MLERINISKILKLKFKKWIACLSVSLEYLLADLTCEYNFKNGVLDLARRLRKLKKLLENARDYLNTMQKGIGYDLT